MSHVDPSLHVQAENDETGNQTASTHERIVLGLAWAGGVSVSVETELNAADDIAAESARIPGLSVPLTGAMDLVEGNFTLLKFTHPDLL